MAQFPAEIQLTVDNSQAIRQIAAVEKSLNKIKNIRLTPFERNQAAKAEAEINKQLDVQAVKYAAIERVQRQLLANDNSRIKANEKLNKTQQFIQDRISIGRAKQASASKVGDPSAYPTTIGPQPNFEALGRAYKEQQAKIERIAAAEERLAKTRTEAAGRQAQFAKLQKAENKAKLEAARDTAQATGELKDFERALTKFSNNLSVTTKKLKEDFNKTGTGGTGGSGGRNRLSSALVGGAFPALFGGGPAAILGGFIGELFGPLGGVVGSALAAPVDRFVAAAGEVGAALNESTADVGRLTEALGATNTSFDRSAQKLIELGRDSEALALATQRLANLVGNDGVDALREFGSDTTELANEFARAMTIMQAGVATVINTVGILKGIVDGIERFNLRPQIRETLANGGPDAAALESTLGGINPDTGQREITEATYEAQRRLNDEKAREAALTEAVVALDITKSNQIQNQLELSRLDNDLKIAAVYELKLQAIELERIEAINQNVLDLDNKRISRLQAINNQLNINAKAEAARNNLAKQREAAFDKADKAASGGSAPKSKALQLQQQLIKEDLKRTEIGIKYLQIIQGEEAALKAKQSLLVERLAKETEVLELQRQQALENNKVAGDAALINQVYDSRIKTLTQQLQLQQQQNAERLRAIALERELQQLKADQAFDAESTGLSRELEDIQARVANPFGGFEAEQLELATAQARRYEDVMRDIANQEELLQKQRTDANASTIDPQLKDLERKRQLYEEMLPAIAAAEQAELKMAQTLERLQPITDGLAAGITDFFTSVIDGSKSAQEAFSDMLRNMAQALIQQGAIMIAQYIAIGIAKAFAGMSGSSPIPGTASNPTPLTGDAATSALTKFLTPRADGGPVSAATPYIVGEKGQELFIPGVSGTIVPNDVFEATKEALIEDGEIITTDDSEAETASALSANNSSISADAETAKALERNSEIINSTLRSSEVQSALTENNKSIKNINYGDSTTVSEAFALNNNSIQSQRMAAATTTERETMQQLMNSSSKMTVSYESTVINQQEYVTAEQHQKGVTQAAMKGRDMALASLKNSVRARKGIGLS